jgi:hypothetical protein
VIVRISSTTLLEASLNAYVEHVERNEIPSYVAASGLVSVWLLQRRFVACVEVMTLSLWRSEEALTQFVEKRPPLDSAQVETSWHSVGTPRLYNLVMSRRVRCETRTLNNPAQGAEYWALVPLY